MRMITTVLLFSEMTVVWNVVFCVTEVFIIATARKFNGHKLRISILAWSVSWMKLCLMILTNLTETSTRNWNRREPQFCRQLLRVKLATPISLLVLSMAFKVYFGTCLNGMPRSIAIVLSWEKANDPSLWPTLKQMRESSSRQWSLLNMKSPKHCVIDTM